MPAADDRRVGLPLGARDPLLEVAVCALGDGVTVAEGTEEGPIERGQAKLQITLPRQAVSLLVLTWK